MDRRTTLALALCLVVFALFTVLQTRYAPRPVPKPAASADTSRAVVAPPVHDSSTHVSPVQQGGPITTSLSPAPLRPTESVIERSYTIETPLYRAAFSNRGARLLSVELTRYAAAYGASNFATAPGKRPRPGHPVPDGDRVQLNGEPAFGVDLGSGTALRPLGDVVYAVAESTDAAGDVRALTFTTRDSAGATIRQTWRVRPDSYALDLEVEMQALPDAWRVNDYSLTARSWPLVTEANLVQDLRSARAVSLVGTNLHRDGAASVLKAPKFHEGAARFAGVQSHYFLGLVASTGSTGRSSISAGTKRTLPAEQLKRMPSDTKADQEVAVGTLVMPVPTPGSPIQRFVVYFGPSDFFGLQRLGFQLERAVDMGWSWVVPLSVQLLRLLRAIDWVVHNFGLTILLLATLVRLLLHPLNMASMKSMRSMQKLQPEIERIRQKYKNDAQALNTATMALYRENKVNPAGGCLPMLLQMPLFIALYAVLFNAIDLRQAPFVAWMHDLSSPDQLFTVAGFPIRILPLLMAASGLLSQKLTPTDPKQAPTMYLMNVMMLVFFYNLPSGLVLYWTVMNLLTALQQWLVMRSDGGVLVVATPAAPTGRKAGRK